MEILKKKSVINLVKRAVKAGNKKPTLAQLKTLSIAVNDSESYQFLRDASINEKAAVKTCIAVLNGEAPKQVSDQVGTLFGMVGEKESKLAPDDAQDKIYAMKPEEKITEEQQDMRARNENDDKHPDTSDRKTEKAAVEEPLKEKTEPEIKKVLDAGEKDPVEKRSSKKTAGADVILSSCNMLECVHNGEGACMLGSIVMSNKATCVQFTLPVQGSVSDEEVNTYASRIKKGENPKNVLSSFFKFITGRKKKAVRKISEMAVGEQVQINDPTMGQQNLTIDSVGKMMGTEEPAIVAKNEAGESVVVPGGTEVTQVMDTTVSSK